MTGRTVAILGTAHTWRCIYYLSSCARFISLSIMSSSFILAVVCVLHFYSQILLYLVEV